VRPASVALELAAYRERLERVVAEPCDVAEDWQSAVAAGIEAALELAAADPAAALALSERATARWKRRDPDFVAMVESLAGLLSRGAPPPNPRLPSAEVVIVCVLRQVNRQIETGRVAEMMDIAPDLAFLASMPFVGFAEARRCAQLTASA
jgi:hypothetical protein